MSPGRTTWYSEDAALHRRELVVELRDEHGPAAVNVYRTLRDISQEQLAADVGGTFLTGYRSLAAAAGVDVDDCRVWVAAMVEIGLLDDFAEREDKRRFTCRVSGWKSDQDRGGETLRKRRQRAEPRSDASPAESDERDLSRHDGTSPPNHPIPDHEPPVAPQGGRDRDHARFDRDVREYSAKLLPNAEPDAAYQAVEQAIRTGAKSSTEVAEHVRRWYPALADELTGAREAAAA